MRRSSAWNSRPGMPRRLTLSCSRGLSPRLTQTKVLSPSSFSRTSSYLRSGGDALRRLRAVAQQRYVAHAQADRDESHGEDHRGDDDALAGSLLRIALEALLNRPVTRAGRRVCRGGRVGRGRPAPQSHRRPPSFRERISSIETAALWPSPSGPVVAGS